MDEPTPSGIGAAAGRPELSRRGFVHRLVGGTSVTLTGGVGQVSRLIAGAALGPLVGIGTASAQGPVTTVFANGDTTLDENNPTTNHGNEFQLHVDATAGTAQDVLITFDAAELAPLLPAGHASLRLFSLVDTLPGGETVVTRVCATSETEATATWANTAAGGGTAAVGVFDGSFLTFDVTALVNSGASTFRLTRTTTTGDGGVALASRESFIPPPDLPQLVIAAAPPVSATPGPSMTPVPTPSSSPGPVPSQSATPTPTFTPTLTPTPTPTASPTPTPTATPGMTPAPTPTMTPAPTPSATPGPTPSSTPPMPTPTPTRPFPTPTPTASGTPAPTPTPTPTRPFPRPTPTPSGGRRTPGQPVALSYEVLPTGQVRLSWAAPTGGARLVDYVLTAGSSEGARDYLTWTGTATSVTTAGAVPQGEYYVRVAARNSSGVGPPSSELLVRLGAPASAPPGAPGTLVADVDGQRLRLAWGEAAGASSYLLDIGFAPGGPYTTRNIGGLPRFDVTAPAGTYYLRVRGLNGAGVGQPSNEVVAQAVGAVERPGIPTGLTAVVSGSNVTLSWATPTSGGPIDDYVVDVGRSRTQIDTTVTSVSEVLFAPGVPTGRYYVRVRARNVVGEGPNTSVLEVVVP